MKLTIITITKELSYIAVAEGWFSDEDKIKISKKFVGDGGEISFTEVSDVVKPKNSNDIAECIKPLCAVGNGGYLRSEHVENGIIEK